MNIRFKVIALLALLFTLLAGVAIVIQQQLVLPSFARLERANALTSMKRLRFAIDQRLQSLQYNAMDWGNWAEAYRFVQDHNPDFIKINITREAMRQLQINVLMLVDLDGRITLCSCDHLSTALRFAPDVVSGNSLGADFPWRRTLGTAAEHRGLVQTSLGPMLIVSAPILDGTGGGEPRGMAIMGRVLTPAVMRDLARQTQADVTAVADRLAAGADRIVETDALTRVYGSFEDVFGRPLLTMRVDVPREITAGGRTAIHYASASLVAAAVFVLILVLVLLNRLVLGPLTRVTRHVVAIGDGAELTACPVFAGSDEIGVLGREFHRMVGRLTETRRQLVDQSFQAGFAEMAKGVLHNLGNAMTPLGVRLAAMEKRLRGAPVADLEMAAAELARPPAPGEDPARRAALAEFIELGCRELQAAIRDAEADIGVMQRQTAIMRASLTEQMRSTGGEPVVEAVRLPDLVAQSLEIVPDASRQRLQVDADESLQRVGAVPIARTVLRLVLQNLIINAADAVRDAGKERGVLRVAAEIVREADREQLHLQCQDDGVGIAGDQLERVFEKGFSTKSRETNHGIGLHWCANAVAALGGRIWAASDGPGLGASLHLLLPLRTAAAMT